MQLDTLGRIARLARHYGLPVPRIAMGGGGAHLALNTIDEAAGADTGGGRERASMGLGYRNRVGTRIAALEVHAGLCQAPVEYPPYFWLGVSAE